LNRFHARRAESTSRRDNITIRRGADGGEWRKSPNKTKKQRQQGKSDKSRTVQV
jgi:hypothetical protein